MDKNTVGNQISWKMVGEEAAAFKEKMVKHQMERYGFTRQESEEATDLWIEVGNEVAREAGEDV